MEGAEGGVRHGTTIAHDGIDEPRQERGVTHDL